MTNTAFNENHRENIAKADQVSVIFFNNELKIFEIVVNRDSFGGSDERSKQIMNNFFELHDLEEVSNVLVVLHNNHEEVANTTMNFDIKKMQVLDRTLLLNNITKGRGLKKISKSA